MEKNTELLGPSGRPKKNSFCDTNARGRLFASSQPNCMHSIIISSAGPKFGVIKSSRSASSAGS